MSKEDNLEAIGYRKSDTQLEHIKKYYKDDNNVIYFNIKNKSFVKSGEYDGMCDDITMQELQAINEKCKELRLATIERS